MPRSILISTSLQSLRSRILVKFPSARLPVTLKVPFLHQKPFKSLRDAQIRTKFRTPVANSVDGQFQEVDDGPVSVELVHIASEGQFDRIIAEAQQLEESDLITKQVIGGSHEQGGLYYQDVPQINTVSTNETETSLWHNRLGHPSAQSLHHLFLTLKARKCIYLKPKLEKLAAEYYPRIQFCCIDVNTVPQRLVNRAGITKMPTIQLWRDGKKLSEVIGGHKAWLVVNDVREMIEREP